MSAHPLLTKVWAAAMAEARPYGGNPDAWATHAAEHVISKFPPGIADRLEQTLDVCAYRNGTAICYTARDVHDYETEGMHEYVPLVNLAADAPETRAGTG